MYFSSSYSKYQLIFTPESTAVLIPITLPLSKLTVQWENSVDLVTQGILKSILAYTGTFAT